MKEIKLYAVKFNTYSSSSPLTVSNYNGKNLSDYSYLDIPIGGLVIKESEIDYYQQFGNGIYSLTLVGSMLITKENN